ncbi:hypothetical protein L218DRAFT_969461 [Marasmius fiardii PR-910]|nr:hypothetical protein L218DRAFT_969461 [Marasmius fiardii PR-910]
MVSPMKEDSSWDQFLCYPTPPSPDVLLEDSATSTTFYPGANTYHLPYDLVLMSSDMVAFYVHLEQLLAISDNHFNSLLLPENLHKSNQKIVHVPEPSPILNIILHVAYGLSVTRYAPVFDLLSLAVHRLDRYGVYLLAAKHDIYDLAVFTSSYLLSFPLTTITEDVAVEMGPVYLARLLSLHRNRLGSLKKILSYPLHLHPLSSTCSAEKQNSVSTAWKLASAYLVWQDRPDLTSSYIDSVLRTLPDHVSCDLCKIAFQRHIQAVTIGWQHVKVGTSSALRSPVC